MFKNTEEKYIDLKRLGELLHIKDNRTITKWCNDKNIEIQIINKKSLVFRFLVEMELDKNFIMQLQSKYPDRWEKLYNCFLTNDKIGYLFLINETPSLKSTIAVKRAIPQSSFSSDLLD